MLFPGVQECWRIAPLVNFRRSSLLAPYLLPPFVSMAAHERSRRMREGFFEHLGACLGTMSQEELLGRIGMRTRQTANANTDDLEGVLYLENEYATRMASFALSLVGHRLRRFLWLLRGWPARTAFFVKGHASEAQQEATLKALRRDVDNFRRFEEMQLSSPLAKEVCRRSQFKLACVRQVVECLKEEHWTITQRASELFRQRNSRLMGTQALEDGFQRQRRKEQVGQSNQGRAQSIMQAVVERRVLSNCHHFREAQCDERVIQRGAKLPVHTFHCGSGKTWSRLKEIVGYNRTPTWWSTTPENACVPHSDLEMVDWLISRNRTGDISHAWMNCLLGNDRLLVREKGTSQWFALVVVIGGSASLGWPFDERREGVAGDLFYSPSLSVSSVGQLGIFLVLDDETYECKVLEWLAPAAQWAACPSLLRGRPVSLIARPTSHGTTSLLTAACRFGLYDFSKQVLESLAGYLGIPCKGIDVFDLAFNIVKTVTNEPDNVVMDYLLARVVAHKAKAFVVGAHV